MEHRIFFVEGIPGSGKTTLASELKKQLISKDVRCHCYEEDERNPLDLSMCAILTEDEYALLKRKIIEKGKADHSSTERMLKKLDSVTEHSNGRVYVFFLPLYSDADLNCVAVSLQQYEVYNGHYSFDKFREVHFERWNSFCLSEVNTENVYICDALFLQSPLFELIGFYDLSFDQISEYIRGLYSAVNDLSPVVYYNRVSDVAKLMRFVCENRKNSGDRWERGFYKWMEASPYCQKHNYRCFDGMCAFLEERQKIEIQLLKRIGIPCIFVERDVL